MGVVDNTVLMPSTANRMLPATLFLCRAYPEVIRCGTRPPRPPLPLNGTFSPKGAIRLPLGERVSWCCNRPRP
jgi:hypothetical protein